MDGVTIYRLFVFFFGVKPNKNFIRMLLDLDILQKSLSNKWRYHILKKL